MNTVTGFGFEFASDSYSVPLFATMILYDRQVSGAQPPSITNHFRLWEGLGRWTRYFWPRCCLISCWIFGSNWFQVATCLSMARPHLNRSSRPNVWEVWGAPCGNVPSVNETWQLNISIYRWCSCWNLHLRAEFVQPVQPCLRTPVGSAKSISLLVDEE